jgi:hypothetical protein
VEVAGREFPQILLIHANELNAETMPDLLARFRRRGYTFVALQDALKDPVYNLPEEQSGTGGFSGFIARPGPKGMPAKGGPDPEWVEKVYASR